MDIINYLLQTLFLSIFRKQSVRQLACPFRKLSKSRKDMKLAQIP